MSQHATPQSTAIPLKMRVRGMDCSACAIKIENALKRLPGVGEININYGTETLFLELDTDRTSREAVDLLLVKALSNERWTWLAIAVAVAATGLLMLKR